MDSTPGGRALVPPGGVFHGALNWSPDFGSAIYSKRWAASVAHPVAVSLPLASKTPTEAIAVNVWWSLPSVMFRAILFDPNQVPSGLNVKNMKVAV